MAEYLQSYYILFHFLSILKFSGKRFGSLLEFLIPLGEFFGKKLRRLSLENVQKEIFWYLKRILNKKMENMENKWKTLQ